MDTEYGNGHRDRQFEIVACGREGDGGTHGIIRPELFADQETDEEHQGEVNAQGDRHPQHVERDLHNGIALKTEHHHDGKQECDQGKGRDAWNEFFLVPVCSFSREQDPAGQITGREGKTEVDQYALSDFCDGDVDRCSR